MQTNDLEHVVKGRFIGERRDGIAIFRGIRYATAGRFEAPKECPLPSAETEALVFGDCCPQRRGYFDDAASDDEGRRFYHNEFRSGQHFSYSEDCLNLNVYAPVEGSGFPVAVYVHGGSFINGSGDEKPFDGSAYAKKGVAFVSINYRLNAFGFYADENVEGNLALRDVIAAISWVRRNIGEFGGDGDNITLMGQSAGAMIIQTLISFGLAGEGVKRAIMLSGGGDRRLLLPLKKPNFKFWQGVLKRSGAQNFEEFKNLSPKTLYEAFADSSGISSLFATAPTMDGKLVKGKRHAPSPVACVYGTVEKDMLPPLLKHMKRAMAKRMAKAGVPAYLYEMKHPLPGENGGTFHSSDLWYALGSLKNSSRPFEERDVRLADEITSRFAAFMRCGDPNADGYAKWKAYRGKEDELVFE